jgi:hypothetical protein
MLNSVVQRWSVAPRPRRLHGTWGAPPAVQPCVSLPRLQGWSAVMEARTCGQQRTGAGEKQQAGEAAAVGMLRCICSSTCTCSSAPHL